MVVTTRSQARRRRQQATSSETPSRTSHTARQSARRTPVGRSLTVRPAHGNPDDSSDDDDGNDAEDDSDDGDVNEQDRERQNRILEAFDILAVFDPAEPDARLMGNELAQGLRPPRGNSDRARDYLDVARAFSGLAGNAATINALTAAMPRRIRGDYFEETLRQRSHKLESQLRQSCQGRARGFDARDLVDRSALHCQAVNYVYSRYNDCLGERSRHELVRQLATILRYLVSGDLDIFHDTEGPQSPYTSGENLTNLFKRWISDDDKAPAFLSPLRRMRDADLRTQRDSFLLLSNGLREKLHASPNTTVARLIQILEQDIMRRAA